MAEAEEVAAATAAIFADGTLRGRDISWNKIRQESYTLLLASEMQSLADERVKISENVLNEFLAKKKQIKKRIKVYELSQKIKEAKDEYKTCVEDEAMADMMEQVLLRKEEIEILIEKYKRKLARVDEDYIEYCNVEELLDNERLNYNRCKEELKIQKDLVEANEKVRSRKMKEIATMRVELPIRMEKFKDKHNWAIFVEITDVGVLSHFIQFIEQRKMGATHLIFTIGRSMRVGNIACMVENICTLSNGAFPKVDNHHLYKVSSTGDGTAQFCVLSDDEMTALNFKH